MGVNQDSLSATALKFSERLTSGEFTSIASVNRSLGKTKGMEPEEVAKLKALALAYFERKQLKVEDPDVLGLFQEESTPVSGEVAVSREKRKSNKVDPRVTPAESPAAKLTRKRKTTVKKEQPATCLFNGSEDNADESVVASVASVVVDSTDPIVVHISAKDLSEFRRSIVHINNMLKAIIGE